MKSGQHKYVPVVHIVQVLHNDAQPVAPSHTGVEVSRLDQPPTCGHLLMTELEFGVTKFVLGDLQSTCGCIASLGQDINADRSDIPLWVHAIIFPACHLAGGVRTAASKDETIVATWNMQMRGSIDRYLQYLVACIKHHPQFMKAAVLKNFAIFLRAGVSACTAVRKT